MAERISPSRPGFAGPTSPASGGGDGASGRLALTDVELEDYAGNSQRYTFK